MSPEGLFTPSYSITITIMLTGDTFDLFDRHYDGLHTHFAYEHNICDGVAWCEQILRPSVSGIRPTEKFIEFC